MLTRSKKEELYRRLANSGLRYSWDSKTDSINVVVNDELEDSYDLISYRTLKRRCEPCYETLLINEKRSHSIFISTEYEELSEEDNPFYALCFYSMHDTWRRKEWFDLVNILKCVNNVTVCISMIPFTTPDYNIVTDAFFTSLDKCRKFLRSKQCWNKVCLNWEPMTDDAIKELLTKSV